MSDITHEDLEPILYKLKRSMRNAEMRHLRAVLKFGIKKGYLDTNPIDRLTFAKIPRKEVQTVPAEIVERMLLVSLRNDVELLPFLVLGFFTGCRLNGELAKLDWRDIHLHDEHPEVVIRSEVSKTRERRFIPLSENAVAWLNRYLQRRNPAPSPRSHRSPSISYARNGGRTGSIPAMGV